METKALFDTIRKPLFKGRMTTSQVKGIERLIAAWDKYGYGLDTALAMILAISYWETGRRMQPVRETFATSTKSAISRLDAAFAKGQMKWVKSPYWRTGFFGRGDVQLTHEDNYKGKLREAILKEFGKDIHLNPDHVLDPDVSAFVLIEGVTKGVTGKADFTKWDLEQFINSEHTDYVNSRKTVNPGEADSYQKIADIAEVFETGIRAARRAAGEEFKGPSEVNIYDGKKHPEIENVQKLLDEKGYPEVGAIDGRYGDKTATSIMSFRRNNGLPLSDRIDDKFLAALVQADKRAIAPARAFATVADLREKGAEDVKKVDQINIVGKVMAGAGVLKAVQEGAEQMKAYSQVIKEISDAITPIAGFVGDNLFWIFLAGGGFLIYNSGVLNKIRIFKHNNALDVSE